MPSGTNPEQAPLEEWESFEWAGSVTGSGSTVVELPSPAECYQTAK
jgi:hypothetical protein